MRARQNKRRPPKRKRELPRLNIYWKGLLLPPAVIAGLAAVCAVAVNVLDRPIGRLVVEGPFQRVSAVQIEASLDGELTQGFLSMDLDRLKRKVESLAWIDEAQIGRAWPDTLIVQVSEQHAAARWGEDGLLNERGELFVEGIRHEFPELARLSGPEGTERQVATVYLSIRDRLAAANLRLRALSMDARGALEIELITGQRIRLGRHEIGERLDRFFDVATPALADEFGRVDYIDLRYTNGFAVGWLGARPSEILSEVRSGHG